MHEAVLQPGERITGVMMDAIDEHCDTEPILNQANGARMGGEDMATRDELLKEIGDLAAHIEQTYHG